MSNDGVLSKHVMCTRYVEPNVIFIQYRAVESLKHLSYVIQNINNKLCDGERFYKTQMQILQGKINLIYGISTSFEYDE
jgi:hypothetical protein